MTDDKESPPVASLTLDELLGAGKSHLKRTMILELDDGKELKRSVVFRRLSFKEISELSLIPREEVSRYTNRVVFLGSIEPKFEHVDKIDAAPNGFIQHYCTLILDESGNSPFLLKG